MGEWHKKELHGPFHGVNLDGVTQMRLAAGREFLQKYQPVYIRTCSGNVARALISLDIVMQKGKT